MTAYDHPEYRALVANIAANPDGDLPRLVAADWLQENGESDRATYIRCEVALPADKPRQCERTKQVLSSLGVAATLFLLRCRCPVCKTIRTSYNAAKHHIIVEWEKEARRSLTDAWVANRCRGEMPWVDFRWNRGFIHSVRGPLSVLREHLPAIVAREPVGVVEVTDKEPISNRGVGSYFNEPDPPEAWGWVKGFGRSDMSWELPPELWSPELGFWFNSIDSADAALSSAILAEARAGGQQSNIPQ